MKRKKPDLSAMAEAFGKPDAAMAQPAPSPAPESEPVQEPEVAEAQPEEPAPRCLGPETMPEAPAPKPEPEVKPVQAEAEPAAASPAEAPPKRKRGRPRLAEQYQSLTLRLTTDQVRHLRRQAAQRTMAEDRSVSISEVLQDLAADWPERRGLDSLPMETGDVQPTTLRLRLPQVRALRREAQRLSLRYDRTVSISDVARAWAADWLEDAR